PPTAAPTESAPSISRRSRRALPPGHKNSSSVALQRSCLITYRQVSTCLAEIKSDIPANGQTHRRAEWEPKQLDRGPIRMTPKHVAPRTLLASTIAALAIARVVAAWLAYSYRQSDAAASAGLAALPQVVVSKPLEREVDSRLGFLGQFSAIEHVELRA